MQERLLATNAVARRTVASYPTYQEAQQAVDYLSDQDFPVERTAIVGEGLRLVEQVTGQLGWGRSALNGALAGGVTGAIIGFIFGLFNWIDPLVSALVLAFNGLVIGAIIGTVFGLVTYAMSGGQRDFSSVQGMQADHFNVMADDDVFNEAYRLLQNVGEPARQAV